VLTIPDKEKEQYNDWISQTRICFVLLANNILLKILLFCKSNEENSNFHNLVN